MLRELRESAHAPSRSRCARAQNTIAHTAQKHLPAPLPQPSRSGRWIWNRQCAGQGALLLLAVDRGAREQKRARSAANLFEVCAREQQPTDSLPSLLTYFLQTYYLQTQQARGQSNQTLRAMTIKQLAQVRVCCCWLVARRRCLRARRRRRSLTPANPFPNPQKALAQSDDDTIRVDDADIHNVRAGGARSVVCFFCRGRRRAPDTHQQNKTR